MEQERERLFSRLSTLPGVRTLPSIGGWILIQVENPAELSRKVNRRLEPGTVNVPRHVPGTVRIPVRDPKSNEQLFQVLRELMVKKARVRFYQDLRSAPRAAEG
jgi:histidinol-phosphate/aromatic aminotransferase/cobyric acid decarboxylase-like protein